MKIAHPTEEETICGHLPPHFYIASFAQTNHIFLKYSSALHDLFQKREAAAVANRF